MKVFIFSLIQVLFFSCYAQNSYMPKTLDMKERSVIIDRWLKERITTVLPNLMKKSGIDMWLIIAREYNEDPILKTMLPSTWQSARRTTILVIYNPGNKRPLETMAMSRYAVGTLFTKVWDKETQPDQWKALANLIKEKNPKKLV